MKKILALLTAAFLASCGLVIEDHNSHGSSGSSSAETVQVEPSFYSQDYAIQTSTAASLLTDSLSFGPQVMGRRNQMTEEEEAAAVEKVHRYLGVMNQILGENPIQSEITESDRPEYSFKVVVTTTGLDGSVSVFTMYVNYLNLEEEGTSSSEPTSSSEGTTSAEESSAVEGSSSAEGSSSEEPESSSEEPLNARKLSGDDDEDEEDEEIDGGYESEESESEELDEEDKSGYEDHRHKEIGYESDEGEVATLSGIAIVGDVEYQLLGLTKTEGDKIKTRYFLFLDQQNWIRISSKSEGLGSELKYDVVMKADGSVSRVSFKIEVSGDKTEVSIFIKKEAGSPEFYKFKSDLHEETAGQLIRISARVDGRNFRAVVLIYTDSETGELVYNYRFEGSANNYFKDGDRDYHDNDDSEEDED